MNLLERLNELQTRHGWLSDDVLRAFSAAEGVPLYRLQEVASFYPHYRRTPPPRATVSLCRDAACHLAGGPAFLQAVKSGLAGVGDVEVHEVSCVGRCEHAPSKGNRFESRSWVPGSWVAG